MRTVDNALAGQIIDRLKSSEWWTPASRLSSGTIQGLTCPACGIKGAAWAYLDSPMAIICNRQNQCGVKTKTLELFPELKANFDKDFQPTKADPHRPAREYLLSRDIPETLLQGLKFWYLPNCRNTGSGAVMFTVGKDKEGKPLANGRLFSPPPGDGKTHNQGSTRGLYWRHPGFAYDAARPVWIVEGIIDALSLLALDRQAIAVLAAGQDPAKLDLGEFPHKVLAFDNDEAGRAAVRKWRKVYPEATPILCDAGEDWNDLITSSSDLEQVKKALDDAMPRFRTNGLLALAESAAAWADTFFEFFQYPPTLFEFKRETFFAQLKKAHTTGKPYLATTRILRGIVRVTGYTIDTSAPANPEFRYHMEVTASKPGARPIETIATGYNISTARTLNEFLLTRAKVNFEGDSHAATALQAKITTAPAAPEVRQLTVTGYQPESGDYVFAHWAVDTTGQLLPLDKRGYFRLAHNRFARPPAHGESKAITPAVIGKGQAQVIHALIRDAWNLNGLAALAWTGAGWVVCQIKEETTFFPFLSLSGDPASGKSALATLLNNIQGREGEGLPISQLNSKKGMVRTIGQVSGAFTALLEDNERNEKGFDYSILLTGFNCGPLQVQAVFSNDMQTRETPFLGSLLFVQNTEPFNSKAERQRVISLQFKSEDITDASRAAYEKLMDMGKKTMAGVMRLTLASRAHFENNWQAAYSAARADLAPMSERRILDNHALILGFYRLFCSCFDIRQDPAVTAHFKELGKLKCVTSAQRQITAADHFFDQINLIDEKKAPAAWHVDTKKGWLIVSLSECERLLRNKGLNVQVNDVLRNALQQHPSYIKSSFFRFLALSEELEILGRQKRNLRAFIFDLEWHKKNQASSTELE